MTITCEITAADGRQLNGRLEATYSNDVVPVSWQGETDLLKSEKVPLWLRQMPSELDANTFESSAGLIAKALGGKLIVSQTGSWETFDEIKIDAPPLQVKGTSEPNRASDEIANWAGILAEHFAQMQSSYLLEFSNKINSHSISIAQYTLLSVLTQNQTQSLPELAEALHHTTPAIAGLVERLVEAGLAERFSQSKQNHSVLVRITAQGQKLVEEIKHSFADYLLEKRSQSQLQVLLSLFLKPSYLTGAAADLIAASQGDALTVTFPLKQTSQKYSGK